jgi:hypothetical protein
MKKRILFSIFQFTNSKTQFELLKLELLANISTYGQVYFQKDVFYPSINIDKIFWDLFHNLNHFYTFSSSWFSRDTYLNIDIRSVKLAVGYALERHLLALYHQIQNDIQLTKEKVSYFHNQILHKDSDDSEYDSEAYKYHFNILDISFSSNLFSIYSDGELLKVLKLSEEPLIYGSFEKYCKQFLLDELSILNEQKKIVEINNLALQRDWIIFQNQYKKMTKTPNRTELKANFKTQTGLLSVQVVIPSLIYRYVGYLALIIIILFWLYDYFIRQ